MIKVKRIRNLILMIMFYMMFIPVIGIASAGIVGLYVQAGANLIPFLSKFM